ncbi:MAG: ATP-dependent helicase, partial [Planctomycetota bacterium]
RELSPEEIAEEVAAEAAVKQVQAAEAASAAGTEQGAVVPPSAKLVLWIKDMITAVGYRDEVIKSYKDAKTMEDRWRVVMMIYDFAENYAKRAKDPSLSGFLEELSLSTQDDRKEEKEAEKDQVTLMTLHSSKGLEFERVYLVGVEEGLLPHSRSVAEDSVEEERRLMYVGITRARKRLTVTWSGERSKYGTKVASMPSRFLFEAKGEKPPAEWQSTEEMQALAEAEKRGLPGPTGGGASRKKKKRKKVGRGRGHRGW